jgi:hypothetical protein
VVCCEIRSAVADTVVIPCVESNVPGLVLPGQSLTTALLIETPAEEGVYRICLWTEASPRTGPSPVAEVILTMDAGSGPDGESCVSSFLDSVARTLPAAHRLQQLPEDYVDVTEGALAPIKRFIKRKMLHNFKDAYVDVLSRQQSQVNAHLVLMIQQLAECCAVLDQAVTGLYQNAAAADPAMEAATRRPHG